MAQKEKAKSEPEIFTGDPFKESISDDMGLSAEQREPELTEEEITFRDEFHKFAQLASEIEPDSNDIFAKMSLAGQAGKVVDLAQRLKNGRTPANLFEGLTDKQRDAVGVYSCVGAIVMATKG